MKKILVPLDLRSEYHTLLEYAIAVAQKSQARLILYTGGRRFLKIAGDYEHDSVEPKDALLSLVRNTRMSARLETLMTTLDDAGINYTVKLVARASTSGLIRECKEYDLLIMGTYHSPGFRAYVESAYASKIIAETDIPVFLVPASSRYDDIGHITYAVDLTDYDPYVIQQVKSLAAMFDAKLTIAHVNPQEEVEKEQYLSSLERTITDTLDYPKVYYKFFDHNDTVSGIKKFVEFNNTHLVAMINRKKFSWSDIFANRSLTRKMSQELPVPLLAFGKYSA